MRTPTRMNYRHVTSEKACLPEEAVILATAVQRARTPSYSVPIDPQQPEVLQSLVNLWVVCGSAGILEFQLIGEGGSGYSQMPVVAGQKVEGHFLSIGPNTTCIPLMGFGNLP